MFDRESIFYKRNHRGEIIINLNFSVWSLVRPWVSLINFLYRCLYVVSHHRPLLFIVAGLGVGFGLGLVVFQRPMSTLASPFPLAAQKSMVRTTAIEVAGLEFDVVSSQAEVNQATTIQHLATSAPLTQSGPKVISVGGLHEAKTYLENLTLNDPLVLIGSNNGRYSFRVVEIKEVGNEVLPTLSDQTGNGLVVYTPSNLWQTTYLVVIAK